MNFYPKQIRKNWPKPAFLRSHTWGASIGIKISKFGAILTHFIKHFTFFPIFDSQQVPKFESCLKKNIMFWKNQAPGRIANGRSPHFLRRMHLSTALYDRIWPTLCRFKVPNFMFFFVIFLLFCFFFKLFMFFPQTPIPYLLCLVRHHQGTNGKHHLPNGKHHLPLVFILNQASP